MKKESLPELIAEIKDELRLLEKLVSEIQETGQNIPQSPPSSESMKKVLC